MKYLVLIAVVALTACSTTEQPNKDGLYPRTYIFVPSGLGMTMIPIYDPPKTTTTTTEKETKNDTSSPSKRK